MAGSAKCPEALRRAISGEVLARTLVTGIAAGVDEIEGVTVELSGYEGSEALSTEAKITPAHSSRICDGSSGILSSIYSTLPPARRVHDSLETANWAS